MRSATLSVVATYSNLIRSFAHFFKRMSMCFDRTIDDSPDFVLNQGNLGIAMHSHSFITVVLEIFHDHPQKQRFLSSSRKHHILCFICFIYSASYVHMLTSLPRYQTAIFIEMKTVSCQSADDALSESMKPSILSLFLDF